MGLHLLKNEKVSDQKGPESLNVEKAREVLDFHKKVEGYQRTNLVSLDALAKELGVKAIYVKDEDFRYGVCHGYRWQSWQRSCLGQRFAGV